MSVDSLNGHSTATPSARRFDPRLAVAIGVGRWAAATIQRLGRGGGTALPGLLALRLDPASMAKLARALPRGTVLVTGTNGKTTTSRLIAEMMCGAGWMPIHNRSGSNLTSGVTSALLQRSSLLGQPRGDSGIFEVDEAVMPRLLGPLRPRLVVLTNLFRDQLDRYGEVDFVSGLWREAFQTLPAETSLVLNADDPGIAVLGRSTAASVVYYGLDAPGGRTAALGHAADSKNCPLCGKPLRYADVRYAHLGHYACPSGDFARPVPQVVARDVRARGVEGSDVVVAGPFGERHWRLPLPGLFNVYNLLAAVASAVALGAPITVIESVVARSNAAFGRFERVQVGQKRLIFALVKNPVGLTEVLRTILGEPDAPAVASRETHLAIFINDNLADGTDVSWLWDAELELLAEQPARVVVGGTRAGDLAVRLKYAGVPPDRIQVIPPIEAALDAGLAGVPEGGTLHVLPTYTATLELRALLSRRGWAVRFWES